MARLDVMLKAIRVLRVMSARRVRPTAAELAREVGMSERHAKRWIAVCYEAHVAVPPTVKDLERA